MDQWPDRADEREIENPTVERCHYGSHDRLRTHVGDVITAYSFARQLKTLGGLKRYKYICKIRTSVPDLLILYPINKMPVLNT